MMIEKGSGVYGRGLDGVWKLVAADAAPLAPGMRWRGPGGSVGVAAAARRCETPLC